MTSLCCLCHLVEMKMAMVYMNKMIIFFLLFLSVSTVNANYCEYAKCHSDQYCCGDNLCCDYVYSLWYFWVGLVFFIMVISLCGGLCRYFYYGGSQPIIIQRITSYVPVARPYTDEEESLANAENIDNPPEYPGYKGSYGPPQGPPPPYSTANQQSRVHTAYP